MPKMHCVLVAMADPRPLAISLIKIEKITDPKADDYVDNLRNRHNFER